MPTLKNPNHSRGRRQGQGPPRAQCWVGPALVSVLGGQKNLGPPQKCDAL